MFLLMSLATTILVAKFDKSLTKINDGDFDKPCSSAEAFEYYNGRTTIYKVIFAISFIPFFNAFTTFIMGVILFVLIGVRVAKAKFWHSNFWSKLF